MAAEAFMHSTGAESHSAPPVQRSNFVQWLAILILAQLVLWTVVPWLLAVSLPLDVVSDGLAWGHEWQWGYYKHPPLPSWTVEAFFDALGDIGPFLLSQICIALTYVFVFLLGREMMPSRWAAAGALLLVGVYYFSIPTPEFNHNVAQMPIWAAACFCYFRAWKTDTFWSWLALGAVAGVGLLAKYSIVALLLVIIVHFVKSCGVRKSLLSPKAWLAVIVCLLLVSVHVLWLIRHGFPTFHYAAARAGTVTTPRDRILAPLKFIAAQAIDIAPALFLAWLAGLRPGPQSIPNDNWRFLLWMTLGPPAVTALGSLLTGMGARDMWGAPMWNLTGLIIVLSAARNWDNVAPKRLAAGAIVLFAIGLVGFGLSNVVVPILENRPSRIQWPDRAIAQTFASVWQHQVHQPLRIVAADGWLGGLLAMRARPRPSVWIDADSQKAPWITSEMVRRDGALLLWRIRPGRILPPALAAVKGAQTFGQKSFAWPKTPKAPPLKIGYAILRPAGR